MSDKELSGRELSALVAERVFGEPMPPIPQECRFDVSHAEPSPKGHWQHVHIYENGDTCEWEPFPYGEEIEAAMQVVEKMREQHWCISILNQFAEGPRWYASFETVEREAYAYDDSLPTAICRASLTAIETKQEND